MDDFLLPPQKDVDRKRSEGDNIWWTQSEMNILQHHPWLTFFDCPKKEKECVRVIRENSSIHSFQPLVAIEYRNNDEDEHVIHSQILCEHQEVHDHIPAAVGNCSDTIIFAMALCGHSVRHYITFPPNNWSLCNFDINFDVDLEQLWYRLRITLI